MKQLNKPSFHQNQNSLLMLGNLIVLLLSHTSLMTEANEVIPPQKHIVGHVDHLAFRTIERRQNNVLETMLREGLSPHLQSTDGTSLIMYAALHGDVETVRILLQAGSDPNDCNEFGQTALVWGAGDIEKVKLLVAAGGNIHAKTKQGMSPLSAAAGHPEGAPSVKHLLECGADPSSDAGGFWGMGALGVASFTGNLDSVRTIIHHLESSSKPLDDLSVALHGAVSQSHPEIVDFLLQKANQTETQLESLGDRLADSLAHSNPEMARVLISHGTKPADVLTLAYSDIELESLLPELLHMGVDINQRTWRNHTALDFARLRGHDQLEAMLLEAGAESGQSLKHKEIPNRGIQLNVGNKDQIIADSLKRGLSLLLRSSNQFMRSRESCNSCHHQDLPAIAATIARSRGIKVDEASLIRINHRQLERWEPLVAAAYEGKVVNPDPPKTIGYLLWGRSVQGLPFDPIIKSLVWHLAAKQLPDGSWHGHGPRMPMQDGIHMATALGLRALKMYPLEGRHTEFVDRIQRARHWLANNPAAIHTHQAFRLLGLAWGDADETLLKGGIQEILDTQKAEGGWSQLENLESDAWATGLALLALNAAGLETSHGAYLRGMEFLVNTQFEDGSWFVRSRSRPSQPHFDSHFPFGWDQWISTAGTAMACASLSIALEPIKTTTISFKPAESILESFKGTAREGDISANQSFQFKGVRIVDFETDIRPMLEESCLECHSGESPKGNYKVSNRTALMRGGESGVPTFNPGHGAESQLIRHITGLVEDMEMPPLAKRRIYPALNPEQVQGLSTWINEGAYWPDGVDLEIDW